MNNPTQVIRTLIHSARSVFSSLPASTFEPRGVNPADQKRRLAYTLLTRNPGVAADLFAAADRHEQRIAR
jgi:hypothetical protein